MFKQGFFDELKSKWFWRDVFVELLATTLFVFMITSAHIVFKQNESNTAMRDVFSSLATGFSAVVLIGIFGRISGAYMNPAATSGAYVNGDISSPRASFYSLVQYTGGVLGAGITWLLTPMEYRGVLGTVSIHNGVTIAQAFTMEAMLTFMLTLAVFTANRNKQTDGKMMSYPHVIGFAYLALSLVGAQHTGGSFNPARAFGASLVRNVWDDNSWLYWVSPYVGATFAGLLNRFLLRTEDSIEELPR